MEQRPELTGELDGAAFRSYYYLKEELTAFCRANGLPASGGKQELTGRIAHYLDTGEILPAGPAARGRASAGALTPESLIEPDFVCSERHRAFFREKIGKGFSFNVAFQQWLKANTGKTYAQAVEAYARILEEKKRGTSEIGRQFEYNAYIRAFFADNPGRALEEAIACWSYKKGLAGCHRYERADLAALD